jgi:uncharacterized integral membrane protein
MGIIGYDLPSESGGIMWIIKSALAVIIILAFIGFSSQNNSAEQVSKIYIGSRSYESVPIVMVIYIAFALGVIFWFMISIFHSLKQTNEIAELKRKNKQLLEEIKALRNFPLEEISPADLAPKESGKG